MKNTKSTKIITTVTHTHTHTGLHTHIENTHPYRERKLSLSTAHTVAMMAAREETHKLAAERLQ